MQILFSVTFFFENHVVYEIMSKCMMETERSQMTSQYGAQLACWITKVTSTHMHTHAHTPGQLQARTHACALTHTNT
jgi:hypothetical protein